MPSTIWCSTFFDVESFSETCIISTTLKPLMSVECQLGMCSCTSYMVRTRLRILRKSGLFCCLRDKAWFLFSTQKPHFNCKRGSGNICQLNMLLYVAYDSEDKLICCNLVMQRFSRNTLVFSFVFNWFTHEEGGGLDNSTEVRGAVQQICFHFVIHLLHSQECICIQLPNNSSWKNILL